LQDFPVSSNFTSEASAMNTISRAILLSLLPLALLRAQEAEQPQKEVPAYEQAFLNLPQDKRDEFIKKLLDAQRLFAGKRVFEALEKVNEAQVIYADSPDLINLRGACEVEFRNFDKALISFKRADELKPGAHDILFNIAEVLFVTKDWDGAETTFTKVQSLIGKGPTDSKLQLARLVEFKLLLCKIKLGKKDEAAALATKYDYLDDSPFPYYAEAAMHFAEGRDLEAEAVMARGGRIFQNPAILSPWQDTMIEFGYIKGFFGGDAAIPAAGDPGAEAGQ
jgi:tetratricopeptide (TPR) repeat protein